MTSAAAPPLVLTIAGSDSGGGAGIQADLKTILALGGHGMTAVTAVTAQNSIGVHGVWAMPISAVRAQFRAVVEDIGVDAVKTGMLGSADMVRAVAELLGPLAERGVPIVVDPVAVSKHGDQLLDPEALQVLRTRLLPLATVATPNLDEAARLADASPPPEESGLPNVAAAVHALGPRWTLVKGGHLAGDATDLLIGGGEQFWFREARRAGEHTHGTGCTLASALATRLAFGDDVVEAVRAAKAYVTGALAAGFALGSGIGPVRHGWRIPG